MKRFCGLLLLCLGLAGLAVQLSRAVASLPAKDSLSAERLQVYSDFIESMSTTNFKFVSNKTFPLDLSSLRKDAPCLQGLEIEGTEESRKTIHSLGPEVLRARSIHLVDKQQEAAILKQRDAETAAHGTAPATNASGLTTDPGVLALSEIAFDKGHQLAVLKYVFLCGSRCNAGVIIVIRKVGARWTDSNRRPCSTEVNRDNPRS